MTPIDNSCKFTHKPRAVYIAIGLSTTTRRNGPCILRAYLSSSSASASDRAGYDRIRVIAKV